MKLKLGDIYNLLNNEKIIKLGNAKLKTIKDKWDLVKNIDRLNVIYDKINKEYNDLIVKFGEQVEDGSFIIKRVLENGENNPKLEEFNKASKELFSIEEEVDILQINIEAFDNDVDLDVSDLMLIKFMITE